MSYLFMSRVSAVHCKPKHILGLCSDSPQKTGALACVAGMGTPIQSAYAYRSENSAPLFGLNLNRLTDLIINIR